jgi:hypothetical protein
LRPPNVLRCPKEKALQKGGVQAMNIVTWVLTDLISPPGIKGATERGRVTITRRGTRMVIIITIQAKHLDTVAPIQIIGGQMAHGP